MRIFYLYQINDVCKGLYDDYPCRLYHILKDIYYTSKYNKAVAISSITEITEKFNKDFLKEYIYLEHKMDKHYCCKNYVHTILSDLEFSQLMESSFSLKLKTDLKYSSFFDDLNSFNDSIFVCDFVNQDYFWLNKVVDYEKKFVKE